MIKSCDLLCCCADSFGQRPMSSPRAAILQELRSTASLSMLPLELLPIIAEYAVCQRLLMVSTVGTPRAHDEFGTYNTLAYLHWNQLSLSDAQWKLIPYSGSGSVIVVGVIGDRIYIGSGYGRLLKTLKTSSWYEVSNSKWAPGTPLPQMERSHCDGASAVLHGKWYCAGGVEDSQQTILSHCEAFDPATNKWMTMAPLPIPMRTIPSCVVNHKWYVCGGYDGEIDVQIVLCYDPVTNEWNDDCPPLPSPRIGHRVVSWQDRYIIAMGSEDTDIPLEQLDTVTNMWSKLPYEMPMSGMTDFAAAIMQGILVIACGQDQHHDTIQHCWALDLMDTSKFIWQSLPPIPCNVIVSPRPVVLDAFPPS